MVISCPNCTKNLELYLTQVMMTPWLTLLLSIKVVILELGYPNSPIWKTIFSPDGIVLGYFYIKAPQISAKPNLDIELRE